MESFPNWQVEEIASVISPAVRKEFIRVVKIYKGEIAVPKKTRSMTPVKKKKSIKVPLLIAIGIGVVIFLIEGLLCPKAIKTKNFQAWEFFVFKIFLIFLTTGAFTFVFG